MNLIREMLSYPFLVRALAGGMMVSLCASLLGVSLVLRRYSMIGDGLSHVSFGALSIALAPSQDIHSRGGAGRLFSAPDYGEQPD